MSNPTPDRDPIDMQTAYVVTALAAALCKQPGIDGQKLRLDFLDALEGAAQSPSGVGSVGRTVAALMDVVLKADAGNNSPS